jgi:hypothetical protein
MTGILARVYPVDAVYTSCGRPAPDVEAGFLATDADRDGALSRAELVGRCETEPRWPKGVIPEPYDDAPGCAQRFEAGDLDADGYWSVAELAAAWAPLGRMEPALALPEPSYVYFLACSMPAPTPIERWWPLFDADRDGRVSRQEACQLLTGERFVAAFPSPALTPSPTTAPNVDGTWGPSVGENPAAAACAESPARWRIEAASSEGFPRWLLTVDRGGATPDVTFSGLGLYDGKQWVFKGQHYPEGRAKAGSTEVMVVVLRQEQGGRLVGFSRVDAGLETHVALQLGCP